jgi:hypothetical protein
LAYYTEWDNEFHLAAFRKRLDDDQIRIKRFGITISNEDKLQFYLEQMYASDHFDKKEMTEWENKTVAIKHNFGEAKLYFEGLVKDYEVYAQNSGGTAGKHNFESANQAAEADAGDELRNFIAGIAQAAVVQEEQANNIRDSAKATSDTMAEQLKAMLEQIAQLTKKLDNKENNGGGGGGGGSGGLRKRNRGRVAVQYDKPRSMGCYCFSHGFHPASENHTSANCQWKQPNHDTTATWNDRKGGSVHWPPPICVSIGQQTHATYAGKTAPTN